MSYLNGRVPDSLLVTVEDNDRLFAPSANSWLAMRAAAARDGVTITIAEPAGAYRSYAVQADMRARPWAYNLNSSSKVGLAAPGQSSHGFGTRFDAGSGNAWLIRNAHRFGWVREFGTDDPNHWAHDGRTAIAGSPAVAIRIVTEEEEDMPFLIYNPSSQHPDRRAWYVPGVKFEVIDTAKAVVKAKLMKQLKRLPSTTPDADVTTEFTDEMWADAIADVQQAAGPAPAVGEFAIELTGKAKPA